MLKSAAHGHDRCPDPQLRELNFTTIQESFAMLLVFRSSILLLPSERSIPEMSILFFIEGALVVLTLPPPIV
jgi:hypothetical protein